MSGIPGSTEGMTTSSWADFRAAEPASKWTSGSTNPLLGMMPGSRRALDLRRDRRFAVRAPFRVERTEVVRTAVEGDTLVLQAWRPGRALRTIRRGNDDASAAGTP